jgi:hypothetical protein
VTAVLLPVLVALAMLLPAPSAWAAAGEAFEIRQLRCEGAACTTAEGIMPGLTTLEIQGALRDYREQGLRLVVDREGASSPVYERRVGVLANGEYRVSLPVHLWPEGSYRFLVLNAGPEGAPVAGGRFTRASAAKPASPRAGVISAADLTGEWRGINGTAGVLQIAADGSYRFNGVSSRYRIEGEEVIFGGPLAPWNDGRARLRSGVIEFAWKNREGFQNWFTFARVR